MFRPSTVMFYVFIAIALYNLMPYPDIQIVGGICTIEPDVYNCNDGGRCVRMIARYNETIYSIIDYDTLESMDISRDNKMNCSFKIVRRRVADFWPQQLQQERDKQLYHAMFSMVMAFFVTYLFFGLFYKNLTNLNPMMILFRHY